MCLMNKNVIPETCIPVAKIEDDIYDWQIRHEYILEQVKKNKYDIVFIGDSITHFWEGTSGADYGSEVWKKYYGNRKVLNLGYGFDRTQNVLWRLDSGELAGQKPDIIVTNIGTNQFSKTDKYPIDTPEDAAAGIIAVADKLSWMFPETLLVFMSVFPRGKECNSPFRRLILTTNCIVKQALAGRKNIRIIDLTSDFLLPDGTLKEECFQPDMVHLAVPGYTIWADAVEPLIRSVI